MTTEAFLDSNYWLAMHSLARTLVTGGSEQSSRPGNLLPKDEQSRTAVPRLNASPGSLASSVAARLADLNTGMFLGEMNPTVLSNTKNLRSSFGASSLVPDDNSAVSKGPQLHRSASTDIYSHFNLTAPPMLLSHSVSVLRSSNVEDSSIAWPTSQSSQDSSQAWKRKQHQGGPTATPQHALQKRPNSPHIGVKQDLCASSQVNKKPRLDIKQDGNLHQHIIQQLLESQDSAQLQGHMPEPQTLIQRHKLQNQKQQKFLQAFQHLPEVDIKQKQQQQMRYQLLEQAVRQGPALYPLDGSVCSRRLMQYLYHLRHRPSDNGIAYWRKFVAEYYAPCSKKRWCLSMCHNVGHHALGVFPQAAMEIWQCDTCGSKSGRGFEATFEVLPRIYKITFESGVIDELLFLDLPRERRSLSGLMMLEYGKAVQESVYGQLRVVREGKLRIVFTHDLKILSWEFCAWNHDELLPRSLVATQVHQLVHNAQKYQSTVDDSGSDGVSTHDLQANCNRFLVAGRQLARNLELQQVDDLGFSRRFIRCLQITEIVNSMRDLISFSRDNNFGPIESLNKYSQVITKTKLPKDELQEKELPKSSQGLPTDRNKSLALSPSLSNNGSESLANSRLLNGSEEAALVLPGYYQKLLRPNSLNSNVSKMKREPSCTDNRSKQQQDALIENLPVNCLPSSCSEDSRNIQDHMIQKLLQQMINNSRSVNRGQVEKESYKVSSSMVAGLPTRAKETQNFKAGIDFENSKASAAAAGNAVASILGRWGASNRYSSGFCSHDNFVKREPDLLETLNLPEEVRNMVQVSYEKGISDGDRDHQSCGWRA